MKRFLSIAWIVFFIVSITAKDITAVGWEIWYVTNKNYVSQKLCENKANPMMHCNGKCFLYKRLKKTEGELQKKMPQRNLKLKSLDWVISDQVLEVQQQDTPLIRLSKIVCCRELPAPTSSFSSPIFHPPTA